MRNLKIFVICPVRNADESEKKYIKDFINRLKVDNEVYYPAEDTDQVDPIGYRICQDNAKAIAESDAVFIFWNADSKGSLFDLGVAFALNKPLCIINHEDIVPTDGKSFTNMISEWERRNSVW